MTLSIVRRLFLSTGILLLPVTAYAQEATFTGTVTDSTGGVLPGVTVTAVLEATGNTFVAVTDDRGVYRIPARVGAYKISAELQGFTTIVREGLQLLVGETLVVNLQLSPSTLAGNDHRHRGSSPLECLVVGPRQQYRSEAGAGDAPPGARLGRAAVAGAREPHHERHGPRESIRGTPTGFGSFRPTLTASSFRTRWAAAASRRSARR